MQGSSSIVKICNLLSNFLNVLDNVQMHERHLLQLLSGIIQWVDPPDAVSRAIECGKSERFYP